MRVRISIGGVRGKFVRRVQEISGENVFSCYQCGKCSAGCPMVGEMDLLPSEAIHMIQMGLEEVMEANTMWICASCLTCSVRCPKGIDIAAIMEALRKIALREDHEEIDLNTFPREDLLELPQIALVAGSRKYTG